MLFSTTHSHPVTFQIMETTNKKNRDWNKKLTAPHLESTNTSSVPGGHLGFLIYCEVMFELSNSRMHTSISTKGAVICRKKGKLQKQFQMK